MSPTTSARLDALNLSHSLRERLVDFASGDNYFRNADLQERARRLWSGPAAGGGLLTDLWVEAALPPLVSPDTLGSLAAEGVFSERLARHLDGNGTVPRGRPLYAHQAEAVRRGRPEPGPRPAVVVTAGTGAGKTEAFLLPILNELDRTPRREGQGIRALILYPMNALVNDQVERLYAWLRGQDRITLCHFTSETPENRGAANRAGVPEWESCRMRTRDQARGLEDARGQRNLTARGPVPDILVTNYSMLEYMLCRPQDRVFFGPDLRAVVLDEAHLYTGTLAAEISLLLRRLLQRCGRAPAEVLHLATSATIGTGDAEELRSFAADLFSKAPEHVVVVEGKKAPSSLPPERAPQRPPSAADLVRQPRPAVSTVHWDSRGEEVLTRSQEEAERLRPLLEALADPAAVAEAVESAGGCLARLYQAALGPAPLVHRLESLLRAKPHSSLTDLSRALWGAGGDEELEGTALLLGLAASARTTVDAMPLLPHRMHVLMRPAHGLALCLRGGACSGPEHFVPFGSLLPDSGEDCPHCSGPTLPLFRCRSCGEAVLAAVDERGALRPPLPFEAPSRVYSWDPQALGSRRTLDVERRRESGAGGAGLGIVRLEVCPGCGEPVQEMRPARSGVALTLSIAAEALLASLPALPREHDRSNEILPARGRRLLAFSDSRMEAARLGPRLRYQHERQLVRAALVELFESTPGVDPDVVRYLNSSIADLEARRAAASAALAGMLEADLNQRKAQLQAMQEGSSVALWASRLAQHRVMFELLDEDSARGHKAGKWSQGLWEANFHANASRALLLLGREVARLPRRSSINLETIGWIEVRYPGLDALRPPDRLLGSLPTAQARRRLEEVWTGLVAALLDTLRNGGFVTLGDRDQDQAFQEERRVLGHFLSRDQFVGEKQGQKRRGFVTKVLAELELSPELAPRLLEEIYEQLRGRARVATVSGVRAEVGEDEFAWLERMVRHDDRRGPSEQIRLVFPELALRRPSEHFLCQRTGFVWSRHVLGHVPEIAGATLVPCTAEDLDRSPRYGRSRREYRESAVFRIGLWAEEHSAQLSPSEARRLQELFRSGMRNLLSATTTMELGIDIGGLSAALLSNVPPGKANYLQRAGRVGRRADGSSVVVTCARPRPFDREVFQRVGDFLDRPLRRPLVFLERQRVLVRHLHAWLMGSFFTYLYAPDRHVGAMQAFGNMGRFCGRSVPPYWRGGVKPRMASPPPPLEDMEPPEWWDTGTPNEEGLVPQFVAFLRWAAGAGEDEVLGGARRVFQGTPFRPEEHWETVLSQVEAKFLQAVQNWRADFDALVAAWTKQREARPANSLVYSMQALYGVTVIEYLSDRRFLPRYGFPIGLHQLRVQVYDEERRQVRTEDQYRLERAGLLALREYVPGSQLLVGGRLITSRGILKHWTGANVDEAFGIRGQLATCVQGHSYYWLSGRQEVCPLCSEPSATPPSPLLFPRYGYTTAAWDPPRLSPDDVDRVGTVETATLAFTVTQSGTTDIVTEEEFAGIPGFVARYSEGGQLLVYNRGGRGKGFAICYQCGYADSEAEFGSGRMNLPRGFERHAPLSKVDRRTACWRDAEAPVLRGQILAAHEPTDILMLELPAASGVEATDHALMMTLAIGLQLSGARLLELDSRELGAMVVPAGSQGASLAAVVYDNVPGGAGHVLELMRRGREWLQELERLLFVDESHDARCRAGCLDCLLTFDAQMHAERGGLRRREVLALVRRVLDMSPAPANSR